MKSFFGAAAVALAVLWPAFASADTELSELFEQEHASLSKLPDRHLTSLLSPDAVRGRSRPESFGYTQAWLDTQPKAKGGDQWRCLAEALYFEARGETVKGQFADIVPSRLRASFMGSVWRGVVSKALTPARNRTGGAGQAARRPARELGPAAVTTTRARSPIRAGSASTWTACR